MRKRTIPIVVAVLVVALAIVAAVLLRKRAAPEPARLLPEADGYFYVNLKPVRLAGVIGKNPPVTHDDDYEEFVRQTGFQFERDLDEAAFAVHAPPRLVDRELPAAGDQFRRYSEIFVGRMDSERVAAYLKKISKSLETYREVNVYNIPLEGRTVRVALLGVGTAAVSNTDGPQVIRGMIDRYKHIALPFGGPLLLREFYPHVPFGSTAWGVARLGADQLSGMPLPGGFDVLLPRGTTLVASLRYTGAVHLKAEAFTENPQQAKQIADQAGAFLTMFRSLEATSARGADADVKAFFDSLKVEENKNRAVLTATVPPGFLKKMFSEPPSEITGAPPPPPATKKPAKKRRR